MDTTIFTASDSMLSKTQSLVSAMPEINIISTTTNFSELCVSLEQHLPDLVLVDSRSIVRQIDTIGVDNFNCFRSFSNIIPIVSFTECPNVFGHKFSTALGVRAYCMTTIKASELTDIIKTAASTEAHIQLICREKMKQQFSFLQKYNLKHRQLDVLCFMVLGLSNEEISSLLHISYDTVRSHVKIILERLGARDRARAISIVFQDILTECAKNCIYCPHPFINNLCPIS